jgi:nitronate monooxygenase
MQSRLTKIIELAVPVIAAPMAGGPTTPAMVSAAARAGSLGFLAAGYKTAPAMAEQIHIVRSEGVSFGVNLFAPNPVPVDVAAFHRYAEIIQGEADRYGIDLTAGEPIEDDDQWHDKIAVLLADPVPVVSFTFGVPDRAMITALRGVGTVVVQTVTSAAEALAASAAGVDVLAVQAAAAGGHSGTLTPHDPPPAVPLAELVSQIRAAVALPLIAAGGIAEASGVLAVVSAGADAVMVGTVLLRTDEAGTSSTHRAALTDPNRSETVVTHAFTGRPARALRNTFIDRYEDLAPYGYPALHHLTIALRRAAAAADDPDRLHLWAGTGYRHAMAEPVGQVLTRLVTSL